MTLAEWRAKYPNVEFYDDSDSFPEWKGYLGYIAIDAGEAGYDELMSLEDVEARPVTVRAGGEMIIEVGEADEDLKCEIVPLGMVEILEV